MPITQQKNGNLIAHIVGPRVVGGRYRCGYWRMTYTVKKIEGYVMTCEWSDGSITTHSTAWDKKLDVVISTPTPEKNYGELEDFNY